MLCLNSWMTIEDTDVRLLKHPQASSSVWL